jgi:cation diffusion facilitator CzcD-associated flavoprotein CzcO
VPPVGPGEDLPAEVEVCVVGTGFSGLGMAHHLRRSGLEDFVVLERAGAVGGTWRDNRYPGAACDVPSHLYSFSFAPNPDWTRHFPSQEEIWAYLRHCVARFGLGGHLRFGQRVDEARFDEEAGRWRVRTGTGAELSARVLVWATGSLSEPRRPAFEGLDAFGGPVFHSAAWDDRADLAGRRVAVVGTGASAVQLVPRIQAEADRVLLFQRTPPWIVPRRDGPIHPTTRALYRRLPALRRLARLRIYLRFELMIAALRGGAKRRAELARRLALGHLAAQVEDEDLRRRLTPDYAMGCKRILLSDDYYPALAQDNVELITSPVTRFGPGTVVDARGVAHPADAVVLATGFTAAEPPYATRLVGRGGVRLSEHWRRTGVSAFLGTAVPEFPNLFFLIGPNSTLAHNSMIYMIESQLTYVTQAVQFCRRPGVAAVEVRPEVEAAYNGELQAKMAGSVWTEGGCASWYLDHTGRNTTLWPDHTWRFRRRTAHFHPGDYTVTAPRVAPTATISR